VPPRCASCGRCRRRSLRGPFARKRSGTHGLPEMVGGSTTWVRRRLIFLGKMPPGPFVSDRNLTDRQNYGRLVTRRPGRLARSRAHTALVTQECQIGVIGDYAAAARTRGRGATRGRPEHRALRRAARDRGAWPSLHCLSGGAAPTTRLEPTRASFLGTSLASAASASSRGTRSSPAVAAR